MNRFFMVFNLAGVVSLAVLLGVQWRVNSEVNQRAQALDMVRRQQAAKLEDDDRAIKGYAADLDEFRHRLTLAESQLKDLESKLNQTMVERNQLQNERDQLKAALSKWMAAVSDRDNAIRKAAVEIHQLVDERNDAVSKFNDLAGKYNAMVKSQGQ